MSDIGNSEILQIIDSVAKEKGIPKDALKKAMEQAVQAAARRKYGNENNIKVEINKNGEFKLHRLLEVVEEVNGEYLTKISLKDAAKQQADAKIGDIIYEELPPIDIGRVSAQAAKQIINQKVNEAERSKQYNEYKDKKGELITGVVKRIEYGNYIIDIGRSEAILKHDQMIKTENFKINDRVRTYVQDVRPELKGSQIFLSRTDDRMIPKLFELEVPEIYDNIIKIIAVAREPGSKAKMAVYAVDTSIDAVGSCVGMRGSRVKAVTSELNGEKIDIILWDRNIAQFIINAMSPAEILKIILDEDKNRAEVIVPNEQLSIAIGRGGQNVRLASKITGWKIDVTTEEQQSVKRNEEFLNSSTLFMEMLQIEEVTAQLLAAEGFSTMEQIASCEIGALQSIGGFEEDFAIALQNKAIQFVEAKNEKILQKLEKLGVEQELLDMFNLTAEEILILAEYGIKNVEDLGVIKVSEFKSLLPNTTLSNTEISDLIKTAVNNSEE